MLSKKTIQYNGKKLNTPPKEEEEGRQNPKALACTAGIIDAPEQTVGIIEQTAGSIISSAKFRTHFRQGFKLHFYKLYNF